MPNLAHPATLRSRSWTTLSGFRTLRHQRAVQASRRPVPRSLSPAGRTTAFQSALAERWADGSEGRNDPAEPGCRVTARHRGGAGRAVVAGAGIARRATRSSARQTITAYFTTATAIYPGDEVRVSGVKVGTIKSIEPEGTQAKMTLHGRPRRADSRGREGGHRRAEPGRRPLRPAHTRLPAVAGPVMADGAVIPVERTGRTGRVGRGQDPIDAAGNGSGAQQRRVGRRRSARFIDSAANALDGNGEKLRQTLAQLSGVGRILADGSGNIVDIIKNLQTFVTALRDSNVQIVQFNDRLATLTSVVDDSKSDLDAALTNLSTAVGEVQRFIAETRDQTSEQIKRLADATQPLVDGHMALENILHLAPNGDR